MSRAVDVALAASAIALAACDAASSEPGTGATLRVPGAQFEPGALPSAASGPAVLGVATVHARVAPGARGERLRGTLAAGAHAAAIALAGDDGHWIVPADPPEADAPDRPSFDLRFDLAADLPPGPFEVLVQARDPDGVPGEIARAAYVADEVPPPEGELVVVLAWRGAADLDLHVVDPAGVEIWAGNPNSYVPPQPGEPPDPDAWEEGAMLDADANAGCRGGGAPREHVVWPLPPGSGRVVVRVDTQAMCGAASAAWYVAAYRAGEPVGAARGLALPSDTRLPHGPGAGVTALELDLP